MSIFFKPFLNRRWVACLAVFCFAFMLPAAAAPAREAPRERVLSPESDSPGLIEQVQPRQVEKKKKSILPFILIGVGVVGIAAALYFLVLKKEQLKEDFNSKASKDWKPLNPAEWSVAGGIYKCNTAIDIWDYNLYNRKWSKTNYTVTVRLMRVQASGAKGVVLCQDTNMSAANGYFFDMSTSTARWSCFKYIGRNMNTHAGDLETFQSWTTNSAILPGAGAWNVMKIVRNGSTYQYFANNVLLYTFTDATYDPRYIVLTFEVYEYPTEMQFDYVYVEMGASASVPTAPVLFNNFKPWGDERELPIRIR